MLKLSARWAPYLIEQGETGMGYWVATLVLKDGRRFPKTIIDSGYIKEIGGFPATAFSEEDIDDIIVDRGR